MSTDSLSDLHVGRPNVGDRELFDRLVDGIFERRWFSNNGQLVQELEERIEDYLGVEHCVLVCNATVGLQLACEALELSGEVILPSYTFVASAHAVQWQKLRPVFVDIDPRTHNLDPALVEEAITEDTAAILGVHVWGRPCVPEQLQKLGEEHGVPVMFDAAHAFGCGTETTMIGNFGACEVFSFHATKFFNTFEGGAITTNDDALAARLRKMKNFGFAGPDHVVSLGTNAKMSEIHAAMGLSMFAKLDEILDVNRERYEVYRRRLSAIPGIRFLDYDDVARSNFQYIVAEVTESESGVSRDQLVSELKDNGILARRYFYPGCHRMEPYASDSNVATKALPRTEELCHRVFNLPTGSGASLEDVDRVCSRIESLFSESTA
ncbi:MAG: DegT/DnrJ/EryC1/StrS family aminotransferase [Verrucomicrobiales bacterium]|nr:DegT/DnrJ/EryC1/StrS family aminotransferase [Verrucomicrobiales bacterium]